MPWLAQNPAQQLETAATGQSGAGAGSMWLIGDASFLTDSLDPGALVPDLVLFHFLRQLFVFLFSLGVLFYRLATLKSIFLLFLLSDSVLQILSVQSRKSTG